MHFLPILSTLRRHRTAAALIVIEIALTCAIVCNALFLIHARLSRLDLPSGIAEDELVRISVSGIGERADAQAITRQDLDALRAIPGVRTVANTNMVPFGNSSWNTGISAEADSPDRPVKAANYMGSEDLLETFGVNLVAGRDFNPDEYIEFEDLQAGKAQPSSIIITQGIADRLFPGQSPLGKTLYAMGDQRWTVVGVVDHIARPNDFDGQERSRWAMFLPIRLSFNYASYVLRVDPSQRAAVLAAADGVLDRVDPNRVITERKTFDEIRRDYFSKDRAMAYLLGGVSLALLVITALGVVGLASFWVQQRRRQIGIRRALGATKGDILRYFQTENFILATFGIILGMGMAYGINLWLMSAYSVPRLPASVLPIGAAILSLLGQLAVLGPALRAAAIPPAIATRSV